MPFNAARGALVSMTLFGFSLPGTAKASSSSGSSSSGSSSSGSSSSGSFGSFTVATGLTSSVSTVAGVLITVFVVRANRLGRADWKDGWDKTERARALLESGLIDTRTNLGVEMSVILSTPATFEQMDRNCLDGGGATLSGFAEAAGLSPDAVAGHWTAAKQAFGQIVVTQADANRFGGLFLSHLARDLALDRNLAAAFLWELARERADPTFPTNASAHAWLAAWMGVPLESVDIATRLALSGETGPLETEVRGHIYADPFRYLDIIATNLGARHPKDIDRRIQTLAAQVMPWMPPEEPAARPSVLPPELDLDDTLEPKPPRDEP